MSKKLCKSGKDEKDGKYTCKKCGKSSDKKDHLCKPKK
jgi:uncharacterized membrane protein YvbJ